MSSAENQPRPIFTRRKLIDTASLATAAVLLVAGCKEGEKPKPNTTVVTIFALGSMVLGAYGGARLGE